jgi:hypothetical protein
MRDQMQMSGIGQGALGVREYEMGLAFHLNRTTEVTELKCRHLSLADDSGRDKRKNLAVTKICLGDSMCREQFICAE